ncbi:hypothetical protein IAT38_005605 [Cryptococcus sp. DSM 104549]
MAPRLAMYGLASTVLAAGVVSSAMRSRANFYAAAVSVGKSSGSLMILANFALFNAICFGIAVKKVFFGQLRAVEYEHIFERLWMFLTESLLALTIFRDEMTAPFILLYGVLVFLKCFHWITADRVDYMDQIPAPGPPPSFHLRLVSITSILFISDLLLVIYSINCILQEGVSSMVIFASEFTILQAGIAGTAARYAVGVVDLRRAGGREDAPTWEAKSMYLFYIDLAVDFIKLLTYLTFFTVIFLHYGLPLHILRDVYLTLRSFISRCGDLVRYRRATRDMDALYPDATEEELERSGDRTCIICREEMVVRGAAGVGAGVGEQEAEAAAAAAGEGGPNETPKKLGCGHVFHFHCLRSWLERQQSCPTCRRDVLARPARNTTNRRNRDRNPPPPAPGAVPAPNAPAAQPPAGVGAGAGVGRVGLQPFQIDALGQMHRDLDDYFPREGGATPTPATAAGPAPGGGEGREQRVQRGIWGGPIIPGRFTPAPLGAAPRFPSVPSGIARPTPAGPFNPLGSSSSRQGASPAQGERGEAGQHAPRGGLAPQEPSPYTPQMGSGTVTPFSSQPPVVFTSTGSVRVTEPGTEELDIAGVTEDGTEEEGEDGEGGEVQDEAEVRRQVAEAALRRMQGLGIRGATAAGAGSVPGPSGSASNDKGKGKEIAPATEALDEWDAIPRSRAYLSSPNSHTSHVPLSDTPAARSRPQPTAGSLEAWAKTAGRNVEQTPAGTREALQERVRVLSEMDERIWGLVGDLMGLKSEWEAEDGVGVPREGTESSL